MSGEEGKNGNGKIVFKVLFWVVTGLFVAGLGFAGTAIVTNDRTRQIEDQRIEKGVQDLKDCINNKLETLMKSDGEIKERLAKIEIKVDYYGKR